MESFCLIHGKQKLRFCYNLKKVNLYTNTSEQSKKKLFSHTHFVAPFQLLMLNWYHCEKVVKGKEDFY